MVLAYNIVIACLDVAFVVLLRRRPRAWTATYAIAGLAIFAGVLALAFGDLFMTARLLAWAMFFHGTILIVACALFLHGRVLTAVAIVLAIMIDAVYVYAFRIEPRWLEVSHHTVTSEKLDRRMRIAVVADIQTDVMGSYERRALERVMAEKPDLILWAGDYIQVDDADERARLRMGFQQLLRDVRFDAPLGVYAVRGNVDADDWVTTFNGSGVHTISNTQTFDVGGIALTGLGLGDSFDPHMSVPPTDRFHIVFGHSPDFALGAPQADVLLAGHTHGGQVRIPGIGPLVTLSSIRRSWAAGRTELPAGRTLIVSRGVGMERGDAPRLRFLCRPEVTIVDLVPR